MRAIEYIENFKKSISYYDVLKRIIKELMLLRLDRDATKKYYEKYLINDIRYQRYLEWDDYDPDPFGKPEFVEENGSIPRNEASEIRENLFKAICMDKSFGYLFFFIASENYRNDISYLNNPINCFPDREMIINSVKEYRDFYPTYNLTDFLEDDLNFNYYNKYDWYFTSDEEWNNFFTDAYILFDNIRVNLHTPDKALKIISDYDHTDHGFKLTIVLFLLDLFVEYKFDLDKKDVRKFDLFHKKLYNYYQTTYKSEDKSTQTNTTNIVENDKINWRDRTNNFNCDTIENVVKSYDEFVQQLHVLDAIQFQYKKEKAKNSYNWDIEDVNQFCDILKEELKVQSIANKSILASNNKLVIENQEQGLQLMNKSNEFSPNEITQKKTYPETRNGYTISSFINSNDLNYKTVFLAVITFLQEKEFDILDFFTDLNQQINSNIIPKEIYKKYPSTKEEGRVFIFCLLMLMDKNQSNFLIIKNLKSYYDNELRIKFINEINNHRKDLNLSLIEIPNLQKEGIIQNTPNLSIENEMLNVITEELRLCKVHLMESKKQIENLQVINNSLMKEISNYEKNNSNESNSKGFTNKQISYVFYYLFNKLGVHFGNSDKTQWARFISKLIGRNEQNIREIITGFDLERKSDQKDLRVVSSLFNELFPKIVEDIENDIK